jgi:prepilin-type N-terminal cleavage/methylation domain-containing protein
MIKNEQGFTLTELLIVISLTAFLSTLVFSFTISYWSYGYKLMADLETMTTRLNVGDLIRESVGTSTGLVIQNSIPDSHALSPDPAIASNNYWRPIHAVPGNTPVGSSGSFAPIIYYSRPSVATNGTYIMNGTEPYEDEYVLYFDGSKKALMLRTLANPGATGNKIRTSCPAANATASCPADKTLATDVASIDTRFFSRTGIPINHNSIYDSSTNTYIGPDFTVVEVVELKLNFLKKGFLQKTSTTSNSTVIRIALRNA